MANWFMAKKSKHSRECLVVNPLLMRLEEKEMQKVMQDTTNLRKIESSVRALNRKIFWICNDAIIDDTVSEELYAFYSQLEDKMADVERQIHLKIKELQEENI